MEKPVLKKENTHLLYDNRFVKLFDMQYKEDRHYMNASRRAIDDIAALKTDDEFKSMLPDAVSCFVVIKIKGKEPRLLLNYEFRYPAGQFLLSVPAGLIDPGDRDCKEPLIRTAVREIQEETGIKVKSTDTVKVVNPLAFSSPGMTDESNALVCAVIELDDTEIINQDGAVGSELFDGYILIDKEQAASLLSTGRDENGNYYSIYTWAGLMYFLSELWK
ncbi:MAG: NUDIX hydrolase [Lachnospiraceae bacterium]|jgi:ADP-ribose pyrophosphatase